MFRSSMHNIIPSLEPLMIFPHVGFDCIHSHPSSPYVGIVFYDYLFAINHCRHVICMRDFLCVYSRNVYYIYYIIAFHLFIVYIRIYNRYSVVYHIYKNNCMREGVWKKTGKGVLGDGERELVLLLFLLSVVMVMVVIE